MKYCIVLSLMILAVSCTTEKEETTKKEPVIENLIEYKDGIYTEYYPGRKKIKMRGAQDKNKVRDGKWVLLSPSGKELSITFFEKGLREGHTIVKYPNGSLNYVGEYLHNDQVGIWKFYDEKGKLIREEDYSQNPVKIKNY